jgi:hypothetical protein
MIQVVLDIYFMETNPPWMQLRLSLESIRDLVFKIKSLLIIKVISVIYFCHKPFQLETYSNLVFGDF